MDLVLLALTCKLKGSLYCREGKGKFDSEPVTSWSAPAVGKAEEFLVQRVSRRL